MNECLVELHNIVKSYQEHIVLDNLNFTINRGEFVSILGESGSGKSTLMNIIGLLDDIDSGEYLFKGNFIKKRNYPLFRNKHIGFVFQLYYLLPSLTVYQNIITPLLYSKKIHRTEINDVVRNLGISHLLEKKADVLSGGEKQRVAVARAVILKPDIIIADEPTGALDEKNSEAVLELFKQYAKNGNSVIMVTHNKSYSAFADKQYLLEGGILNETNSQ